MKRKPTRQSSTKRTTRPVAALPTIEDLDADGRADLEARDWLAEQGAPVLDRLAERSTSMSTWFLMTEALMERAIKRAGERRVKCSYKGNDQVAVKCDNPEHEPHIVSYMEQSGGSLYAKCDCASRGRCYHMAHGYYQLLHAREIRLALRANRRAQLKLAPKPDEQAVLHTGGINRPTGGTDLYKATHIRGIRI